MNTNRMFGITTKTQESVTEKLSSGYKINRAADDAAGLSISEKMRRQIRGLTQASLNCQDGISLVQTADGAMAEIHEMLDRCTELSVKAANGTLTDVDRGYIQSEIDAIDSDPSKLNDLKQSDTGFYTTCCTCDRHYSIKFVEGAAQNRTSGNHYIYEVSLDGVNSGEELVDRILAATGSRPNNHYTSLAKDSTNHSKLIVYENRQQYAPSNTSPTHVSSGQGLAGEGIAYAADQVPTSRPVDIFIQAGQSMLATANQSNNGVLSLLQ